MAWYLRALQHEDGQWSCRWGTTEYDLHDELDEAVAHLQELARSIGTAALFVHPFGGPVQRLALHPLPGPRSRSGQFAIADGADDLG